MISNTLLSKVREYLILRFLLMIGCFFFDFIVLNYALTINRVLCVDFIRILIDRMSFCDICLSLISPLGLPYHSYKNYLV